MLQDLVVSRSVNINVSIEKVWQALTTPEIIKLYLFGTETITDWKVGSEIIFQGEYEGTSYKDHGIILENIPNSKLSYSYWSGFSGIEDKPENYSTVTCTIKNSGNNHTELTWTQSGFANEGAHKHSEDGMDEFLNSIKKIIEKL